MINMILAIDLEGGIGKDGTLPWHYSEDLKRFKFLTQNDFAVMGRNTWNDPKFPKPLKGRKTVVCSRNSDLLIERYHIDKILDCEYHHIHNEVELIHRHCRTHYMKQNVWIIGGAKLYNQMITHVDNVYLTLINDTHDCDTFFDTEKLYDNFELSYEEIHEDYSFLTYKRNK